MSEDFRTPILEVLSRQQMPVTAHMISSHIPGSSKQSVNSALYSMVNGEYVEKLATSPPTWKIATPKHTLSYEQLLTSIGDNPITARDLAAYFSVEVKVVNSMLYELEKVGYVKKTDGSPPTWTRPNERDVILIRLTAILHQMSLEDLKSLETEIISKRTHK